MAPVLPQPRSVFLPVTVEIAGQRIKTRTDTSGYINLLVENHGLAPGWHEARIVPEVGEAVMAPVVVVDPDATIGLVSDIDDTVVVTWLPRAFLAAWNSFVLRTNTRTPVSGMADFYHELLAEQPQRPCILPVHRRVEHAAGHAGIHSR